MKNVLQNLSIFVATGVLAVSIGTAAWAQDYRRGPYSYRYNHSEWYQGDRRGGWHERDDWNRRHPSVYVAPGRAYYPPPVVYVPPPAHPGFNFYFGF